MENYKERNPLKWPLSCIAGILTILIFFTFLVIAWILFPNPATPLDHFLSDFGRTKVPRNGNPVWDPKTIELYSGPSQSNPGAIWFNLGCILTGCILFFFYAGFLRYKKEGENEVKKRNIKILTYALVCFGFIQAFSMVMTGIFYEDYGGVGYSIEHDIWSLTVFAMNLPIMAISGYWTRKLNFKRYISVYAWIIVIFDIIVVISMNNIAIIEWIAMFTSFGLVAMLVIGIYKKEFS